AGRRASQRRGRTRGHRAEPKRAVTDTAHPGARSVTSRGALELDADPDVVGEPGEGLTELSLGALALGRHGRAQLEAAPRQAAHVSEGARQGAVARSEEHTS